MKIGEKMAVGRPINPALKIKSIIHYPNLKTVLAVEDVIRNSKDYINKTQIMNNLENKIMSQTLNLILAYFEDRKEILITNKGILWIRNDNPKFLKMIKNIKYIEDFEKSSSK